MEGVEGLLEHSLMAMLEVREYPQNEIVVVVSSALQMWDYAATTVSYLDSWCRFDNADMKTSERLELLTASSNLRGSLEALHDEPAFLLCPK